MSRDRDRRSGRNGVRDSSDERPRDEQVPVQRGPNPPRPADNTSSADSRLGSLFGPIDSLFGPRWAVARRELGSLRSEKTIVLALAIQLVIAGFSSFLVVGLVSLYDPGSAEGYGAEIVIAGQDAEDVQQLRALADERDGLEPTVAGDRDEAIQAFDDGQFEAVLEVTRDAEDRLVVGVTAADDGLETTLLVVQLQELLESLEHEERVANADALEEPPLTVPTEGDASPYVEFTYTVLVPLLLFLPVFISGSIVVDSLIEERSRGTLELLRVSPLSLVDIADVKLLTIAALAPLQAAAWLVLLAVNGTGIALPAALVVFVSALALLVTGVGTAIALVAPDRRQAQIGYSVGIVAALVIATLLPEHPANTVAKLAIGSPTATTWLSLAGYCLVAVVVFLGIRSAITRLDTDSL
ncbi:ABC transporter permease [Natronorubrum texcoconense]|uniref:ABC-type Na+ efflux pump, permease component n=1 Tax=Natronorubrum texcoconense TaxID=1095776 RepID=A0A1G9ADR0_9EURY|nr:ABC transporter permease [Natronorubrum texcoconense]SDK24944.1 ABC-type Na+ efflux pump, permease component [Natronorubrum texcoconense]